MAFVDCPQCKICKSPIRSKIDSMISKAYPYSKIISFANKNGLNVKPFNISKHKIKHCMLSAAEISEKTLRLKNKTAARENFNNKFNKIVSANKCLEDIITCAYDRMANGEVKPTIDNALKAIELQARLKETGMLESSIITFMLEFSREGANIQNDLGEQPQPAQIDTVPEPIKGVSDLVNNISETVLEPNSAHEYIPEQSAEQIPA